MKFRHLEETNQTYLSHFIFAFTAGLKCIAAGTISIIHALVPDCLPFTAEHMMKRLVQRAEARRHGD